MRKLSLRKKIIFSITAIILFFLLLEGGIRGVLFFTSFNKEERIVINSKGFRGEEFNTQKSEGIIRIIMMGDSVTFGITPETCPYPAQLQRLFDEKYPDQFEIINAGVEGYSSEYVLKRLKHDILQYQPDIITVHAGWNDLYAINPESPWSYKKMSSLANFLNKFYIYKGGRKFIFLVLKPKIERFLERDISRKDIEAYQDFQPEIYSNNMKETINICRENDIKIILINLASILSNEMSSEAIKEVHYPYFFSDIEKLRILQQNYNDTIEEISQEENISLIDINRAINQIPNKENLFFDTMHPYCSGNAVIAQTIFDFFVNQKIINIK